MAGLCDGGLVTPTELDNFAMAGFCDGGPLRWRVFAMAGFCDGGLESRCQLFDGVWHNHCVNGHCLSYISRAQ